MKVFGLTGGVGMGKSQAGDLLGRRGVAVVDADLIARQVVERGQPALSMLQEQFGPGILLPDGRLNREEMARLAFGDPVVRKRLEAILHPRILERWQAQVQRWSEEGRPAAVVIIPLLFETDSAALFDATVCVACSAESQRQRLRQRNWSSEQIRQRVAAQWPVDKKMALADFVVWTDTTLEAHAAQLERLPL